MSAVPSNDLQSVFSGSNNLKVVPPLPPRPLHSIAEVRKRQGVSIRSVARRMGVEVGIARQQEDSNSDIKLSDLYRWQRALEVPVGELLPNTENQLSGNIEVRAKLVKVMKTVVALNEVVNNTPSRRMVQMLREQLLELMPELHDVAGWPQFGARRQNDRVCKLEQNPISLRSLRFDGNDGD